MRFPYLLVFIFISFASLAQKPYRGAEVFSHSEVLYGKFEMSMKMIKGSGMLSTFFTYKGDSWKEDVFWEEIDIEIMGREEAHILSTNIITDGLSGETTHKTEEIRFDYSLADNYHKYTLVWTPEKVVWYVDDVLVRKDTSKSVTVLRSPEDFRFNAWVSCSKEWAGSFDRSELPKYQYVDYIEYHSYDTLTNEFSFEWRDDFDMFDNDRWGKANWTFDCNEVAFTPENAYIKDGKLVLAITDPNPLNKEDNKKLPINIETDRENKQVRLLCPEINTYKFFIVDVSGKILKQGRFHDKAYSVSYQNLNSGIYIFKIQSEKLSETKVTYLE